MCYSAQIWADYRKYERTFGAGLSIADYVRLFWERRRDGGWQKIPKAMKAAFAEPRTEGERELAAITDEPPAEVSAAGHDRRIIPIKSENVETRLSPDPGNLAALHAILDDRDRPYYEHRMAARVVVVTISSLFLSAKFHL